MVVFEQGEARVQMLSLDRDGICIADLENSNANVVFVTPSHQFPYGMIMPITRRMQLLQWAKKKRAGILLKMIMIVNFAILESLYRRCKG